MPRNHIIQKQIIDLTLDDSKGALHLQSDIGIIFKSQIIPVIEKCCTNLSCPGYIHKIDKLELDIGRIHVNDLKTEIPARIEPLLYSKLSETIQKIDSSEKEKIKRQHIKRKIELILHFLDTGTLPWWADAEDKNIEDIFHTLIMEAPDSVKTLVKRHIHDSRQANRLIQQFSHKLLIEIIELFSTSATGFIKDFDTVLNSDTMLKDYRPSKVKDWLCLSILSTYASKDSGQDIVSILESSFLRLAGYFGVEQDSFFQKTFHVVNRLKNNGHQFNTALPEIMDKLKKNSVSYSEKTDLKAAITDFLHILQEPEDTYLKIIFQAFLNEIDPKDEQKTTYDINKIGVDLTIKSEANYRELRQVLEALLEKYLRKTTSQQKCVVVKNPIQAFSQYKWNDTILKMRDTLIKLEKKTECMQSAPSVRFFDISGNNAFSQTAGYELRQYDTVVSGNVYINNAGMVLLWPYLPVFFEKIRLAGQGVFMSRGTRERAVLLLQYLFNGSKEKISEHLLPLNKVICGMNIDEPVTAELYISRDEQVECENLLNAVLKNWGVLKNTTTDGLRKGFFLREGILKTQDGNHLLQVEKMNQDVLLDKLPWSISNIKLPWMETILFVEW